MVSYYTSHRGPTLGKKGPPAIKKNKTKKTSHMARGCEGALGVMMCLYLPDAILNHSHFSYGVAR